MYETILCIAVAYNSLYLLIMITATFSLKSSKRHILAVKFNKGYEKDISFLVIPKSLKVLKLKVEKFELGSCYISNSRHSQPSCTFKEVLLNANNYVCL